MIGVCCSEHERKIAREFYELFKTPWEFFNPVATYDVVITTQREMPISNSRLIIIYSSDSVLFDESENLTTHSIASGKLTDHDKVVFPVYGKLLCFEQFVKPLLYSEGGSGVVAIEILEQQTIVIRAGFDLFYEIAFLLTNGQPAENALFPTLELHISIMRNWILSAGIPLVEIPPIPLGYKYFVGLTHDIDFIGIRLHMLDRTMWGFVYRAIVSTLFSFVRSGTGLRKLARNWFAVLKLPFVYAGIVDDFWGHFERYAEVEAGFGSTFFVIPYKNLPGENPDRENIDHPRRAAPYGVGDITSQVKHLLDLGLEVGLHGIDAWHSMEKGSKELEQVSNITGEREVGVRMHWLYYNSKSPVILEKIGFNYDATLGYNETIGFKNGTMQVFRPLEVTELLEIPLTIQDTALFYPRRLALKDAEANRLCTELMDVADCYGGILTLSWHDRSLEPERLWGDFYVWLLQEIRDRGAWIGSARHIVKWFRQRRSVKFEESCLIDGKFSLKFNAYNLARDPQMFLRFYIPAGLTQKAAPSKNYQQFDVPLNGEELIEMSFNNSEVE